MFTTSEPLESKMERELFTAEEFRRKYPNIVAATQGRVDGSVRDWSSLRAELALLRYSVIEKHGKEAKVIQSQQAYRENVHEWERNKPWARDYALPGAYPGTENTGDSGR